MGEEEKTNFDQGVGWIPKATFVIWIYLERILNLPELLQSIS